MADGPNSVDSPTFVDSHCHLDYPGLEAQADAVVARADAAGVRTILTIATRLSSFESVLTLASRFPNVWVATGVHPHQAAEETGCLDPAPFIANAGHEKVVAIGECGLDYFYDKSPRDLQAASFRAQLEAARRTLLPFIVHTRDADADTATILEEAAGQGPLSGVIHCYSTSPELGWKAVELGLHLGLGGILTFKRSDELRATVCELPKDRILLETDAPFLAPQAFRGKRNEPAYIPYVAQTLAELWQTDTETVARITTANFFALFNKAVPA
jgi:TatD DNase family protein